MTTSGVSAASGPLGWVHPEIEVALDEVLRALARSEWADQGTRIGIQAHLHQVSGALHMVELPGPQRLAEELEATLAWIGELPDATARAAFETAIAALRADLQRRLSGLPVRDLDLLTSLQGLGALRGRQYGEAELFFPDLSAFPAASPTVVQDVGLVRNCRAAFQRGLLGALRNPSDPGPRASMAMALQQVGELAPGRFGSARWGVVAELVAALPAPGGAAATELRRFYTRIDRQLRGNTHGDDTPNDAMLRDALHFASRMPQAGPALQSFLRAARVAELLAPLPSTARLSQVEGPLPAHLALQAAVRRAEEELEAWFREQAETSIPAVVGHELDLAATQLDLLGEDAALLLLDEARLQMRGFPSARQLTEARLEPVAEVLGGLHQYADSLVADDGLAAVRLEALRERLRELPGASSEAARPAHAFAPPDMTAHAIDETLFSVFLEEADGLLRSLHANARALYEGAASREGRDPALTALRAALQTLRGSGLMAGLLPLAQLTGELDHTLVAWAPRGDSGWEGPARLIADSAREMERWLARLASDRRAPLPAIELIDRARALRAQPALSLAPLISLQDIFLEEAGDRLEDLQAALGDELARVARSGEALRAVHTLGGIARTAGHPGMAELARAMETLLEVLRMDPGGSVAGACERLHGATGALEDMRASLVAGQSLIHADELVRALRRDADLLHEQSLARSAGAYADAHPRDSAGAADAVDQPDPELLAVFLEECAELMPMLDAALRAWSEDSGPELGARAFKRGLHTLKGSARMCGLLGQGARAHRLEDLVLRWSENDALPDASAFDEIQAGLDALGMGIEQLRHRQGGQSLRAERSEAESFVPPVALPARPEAAPARAPATGHDDQASALPAASVSTASEGTSESESYSASVSASEFEAHSESRSQSESESKSESEAKRNAVTAADAVAESASAAAIQAGGQTELVGTALEPPVVVNARLLSEVAIDAAAPDLEVLPPIVTDHGTGAAGTDTVPASGVDLAAPAPPLPPPEDPQGAAQSKDAEAAQGSQPPQPSDAADPAHEAAPEGEESEQPADSAQHERPELASEAERQDRLGDAERAQRAERLRDLDRAERAARLREIDHTPADARLAANSAAPGAREEIAPAAEPVSALMRIRVETLDRMANAAGEAGIGRARIETESASLKRGLSDLAENIQRLKGQLREIEIHAERALPASLPESNARHGFDPLEMDRYSRLQELARTLTEGVDDVQTLHQGLRRGVDEVELALRQQGRVIRDLQQDLLRARMVPFTSVVERLQRTVRQAARECGHDLVLEIEGGQHEVDRSILERLAAPLEHLLRNAAVHAIESAEVRSDLGKPLQGQLAIRLTPGEHEVSLRVADDGRGVDLDRVRAQAQANGLLGADQSPSDEELLQLIFRPGFSTARSVTSLAGRGVGLDVVRSEVLGLGGRIHVDTRPGAGSDFTLVIPVTLATVQAVVVRAGDAWFAIPAPLVEQVRPVEHEALTELYRERVAVWQGLRYPFTSLTRVLGLAGGDPEPQGTQQLVFLHSADRRCALRVEELAGTQEIVVKTVSPHLARVPGVTGASVLGNGRIVLILNPVPLAVGVDGRMPEALQLAEPRPQVPRIMVVDDSITVRRITTRLLERAGYQVQLAKDGQDALEQLEGSVPDAMLLDVEMPRMDGFELITRLRADPRTAQLPIIVITSRTADRHRAHAEALGVQGYLGKPYREEGLLLLLAETLNAACPIGPDTPGSGTANSTLALSLAR